MILHPGILSLISLSLIALVIMAMAGFFGVKILIFWDRDSSTEGQLKLERRTWLISSLLNYAFSFQVFSVVLFVYTADEIHPLFIGAMCATGALNANLVGWLVLLIKIALFFLSAIWIVFNRLDQRTEDLPLTRIKYAALILLIPLVALDFYLQWLYFSGLQPEVITSCCGSLFSAEGEGVAAELSGLEPRLAMRLFFSVVSVYAVALILLMIMRRNLLRLILFGLSVLFFFSGLGAIVSFISLYIYQMPTHHCPFDMLQHHYAYIGYPLYAGLFSATLFGLLPGLAYPLKSYSTVWREVMLAETRWLMIAGLGLIAFLLCSCWQMVFGPFKLLGYAL